MDLFEIICRDTRISPNFVASILCGTITNLERRGMDAKLLKSSEIIEVFSRLAKGEIAKESLEIIFEGVMSGESKSIFDAIKVNDLSTVDEAELNKKLDELVEYNVKMIEEQGIRSIGPLMGLAMKTLRGKVDGQKLNQLLEAKIKSKIDSK